MKLLIVIQHRFDLWSPPLWFAERLRGEFPEVDVLQFHDYAAADPHLPEADIIMTWSLRPEQFVRARKLRWIHSPAAAVHALLIPEIVASHVMVTNASPVHGPVVAEHALALMLALSRRLPTSTLYQQRRQWAQQELWNEQPRPRELSGATLGLIGVGAIGARVAQLALAFDMRVLAVRERPERGADFLPVPSASSAMQVLGFSQLDQVLAAADFVVLTAPLTERTRGLMNAARLACMKPDAYLVNVSRGALVDEAALVEGLRRQQIGGAALDVFAEEPLPAGSPLWELPNLLVTPHSAGFTEKVWQRHYDLLSDNLRRFQAGHPLRSVVDKQQGY